MNTNKKTRDMQLATQDLQTNKESGVSTILAVGLSAMLLMMALAYVTTSIIEKRSSYNYGQLASARMLARTAISRAILSVENSPNEVKYSDIHNVDTQTSYDAEEYNDLVSKIHTWTTYGTNITTYFTTDQASAQIKSSQTSTGIAWSYIESDGKWIGRLAYMATDNPSFTDTPKCYEAFWVDDNSDTKKDLNELYHRFNLARTDWSNLNVSTLTNINNLEPFTDTSVTTSNVIPWLANWNDYSNPNPAAGNQIIANLIDYCDANNYATSDYASTSGNPTYVGLDKCPYINEIRLDFPISILNFFLFYLVYIDNPQIDIELVNMYTGNAFSANTMNTTVTADMTLTISDGTNILLSSSLTNFSETSNSSPSISGPGYYKYSPFDINGFNRSAGFVWGYVPTIYISLTVNRLTIKLTDINGTNLYDFSYLNNGTITYNMWNGFSGLFTCYLDYEVSDPRQNLLASDWSPTCGTNAIGTLTAENTPFTSAKATFGSNNTDKELTTTTPWTLSTAYIRNAPMQSPWELGVIHRAKAFQTLNLKLYNTTAKNYSTGGGGSYSSGDANILDQVKMNSDIERYLISNVINLNNSDNTLLTNLFSQITKGCLISDPNNGGTAVGNTSGAAIAENIIGNRPTTLYPTRASILSNPGLSNYITQLGSQNTDAAQEEVIGKYVQQSDALPEEFYILGIGETFRDLAVSVDNSGNTILNAGYLHYDANTDTVLATQKILARIGRDIGTDSKYEIIELQYLPD